MDIKMYSTPTCPWCRKAKEWLKKKRIPFQDFDVVEDEKAREEMINKSGQMAVPVLDIDGEIMVGFQEARLEELTKKKEELTKKKGKK